MSQYQLARFCVTNSAIAILPLYPISEFYAIALQLLRYLIFKFYLAKGGDIAYGFPCISVLSFIAKVQV